MRAQSHKLLQILSAALVAAATVGPAYADEVLVRSAVAGKAEWMDDYYGWSNDCKPIVYDIDVVDPPRNGKVAPKPKVGTIPPAKIGSARGCIGKPFKGWSIFYTPARGYRGSDQFRVRMRVGNQSKFFTYRINVH